MSSHPLRTVPNRLAIMSPPCLPLAASGRPVERSAGRDRESVHDLLREALRSGGGREREASGHVSGGETVDERGSSEVHGPLDRDGSERSGTGCRHCPGWWTSR